MRSRLYHFTKSAIAYTTRRFTYNSINSFKLFIWTQFTPCQQTLQLKLHLYSIHNLNSFAIFVWIGCEKYRKRPIKLDYCHIRQEKRFDFFLLILLKNFSVIVRRMEEKPFIWNFEVVSIFGFGLGTIHSNTQIVCVH